MITKKKILLIEPHRPNFFWTYVATELGKRGHEVVISQTLPIDAANFDIIFKVYLDESTAHISRSVGSIPVVAFAMGTDIIQNAFKNINFKNIKRVIIFNNEHETILKRSVKFAPTRVINWFANDPGLHYKERTKPEIVDGKIKNLRLLNTALHTYLKGLDNLVQMLNDCTNVDLETCTLHVIGPIGEVYLSYYLQDFCLGQPTEGKPAKAKFRTEFHGEIKPGAVDSYVESIDPHFTVMASQGEMGATTVMESLFKGIPPIVLEHPFIDGAYKGAPIYRYNTASELNTALLTATTEERLPYLSPGLNQYAKKNFTLASFCDKLEKILLELFGK